MIIDVHNHIYPDQLAVKHMAWLRKDIGYNPVTPCTFSGLLENMEETGTDRCVVVDVALKPHNVISMNNWLMSLKHEKIIPFGAMHPDFKDFKQEIQRLKENGIKGVKFQSTWQDCFVDDDRMLRIYEAIGEDMIVFLHAGGSRTKQDPLVQASPHRIARVLELFPKLKIVAAHFGGNYMLEESRKHLVGKNIFFDTAAPPALDERMDPKMAAEFIKAHGEEKILFGTDFPLCDRKREADFIKGLPLSEEAKEGILWRNVERLLQSI